MKSNSQDFEIRFYERLVQDKPDYVDALTLLAQAYTQRKQYRKGLRVDQQLARLCPTDPVVYYNLACSYALLGFRLKALTSLKKAVALGYQDFRFMKHDPDLASLHQDEAFLKLFRRHEEEDG